MAILELSVFSILEACVQGRSTTLGLMTAFHLSCPFMRAARGVQSGHLQFCSW